MRLVVPRLGWVQRSAPVAWATNDGLFGSAGPLVLLIEDYADTRELYVYYLSRHGYRVVEADTGVEGRRRALALIPDVILMDLSLPGIDGWSLTRELKRDSRTCDVPIIAVTAYGGERERKDALDAGCIAVVLKPCPPQLLVDAIARTLNRPPGG